jgi:hypothetical protein
VGREKYLAHAGHRHAEGLCHQASNFTLTADPFTSNLVRLKLAELADGRLTVIGAPDSKADVAALI